MMSSMCHVHRQPVFENSQHRMQLGIAGFETVNTKLFHYVNWSGPYSVQLRVVELAANCLPSTVGHGVGVSALF
jgi:hypothetical protein